MNLKETLDKYNLSAMVIFGQQVIGKKKIRIAEEYSVYLFVRETKDFFMSFEQFKQSRKLKKGQNWKSEYTKVLKKRIDDRMKNI